MIAARPFACTLMLAALSTAALATSEPKFAKAAKPALASARPAVAPAAAPPLPRASFLRAMDLEHSKMDFDKNGSVSKTEIEQFQRSLALAQAQRRNRSVFAALDTDRNGQISATEFARLPAGQPRIDPSALLVFDSNRDGSVSLIEHRAGTLANFDRLDTDKDGSVTNAEMRAVSAGR